MNKPRLLWISLEPFRFPLDETSDEKYRLLGEKFESYVQGVNPKNKFEKIKAYDTEFYLMPRIGKLIYVFPIYIAFLSFFTPYLIFKKKINIIICSDPFIPGVIGAFWKRILFFKKLGLLVEAFGNWTETPAAPLPRLLRWPVRIIIKTASYFSISAADALRAESQITLDKLKMYKKKDVPSDQFNIMHMELFEKLDVKAEEHKGEFHILFIGRVVKLKGVQYLIDILHELKNEFREARLIVGGDGDYLNDLKNQTKKLGMEDKVKFIGNLSRQQVKQQLANCDLFILPSMSEGRPRVLIEAMAMRKFMIASNVGAIPEIIEDGKNGFLINPYDVKELKEKIVYCLRNKKKIKELGIKENKMIMERFGDRFTLHGWNRLYSQLLMKIYEMKH